MTSYPDHSVPPLRSRSSGGPVPWLVALALGAAAWLFIGFAVVGFLYVLGLLP